MLAPYSTWQVVIKAPYVPQSRMNVYYYPNFPNSMELSELGKDVGEFSINVWPTNSGIANYTTKIMRSPSIKSFALCFSFKSEKDFQNSCISFGTIGWSLTNFLYTLLIFLWFSPLLLSPIYLNLHSLQSPMLSTSILPILQYTYHHTTSILPSLVSILISHQLR